jgi:hypothetical protein
LLLPEDAVLEVVAPDVGIVAGARLAAAITTASLSKASKSARCRREHAVYAAGLANWRAGSTAALAEPEQARASPRATHADCKRIK